MLPRINDTQYKVHISFLPYCSKITETGSGMRQAHNQLPASSEQPRQVHTKTEKTHTSKIFKNLLQQ